MAFQKETVTRDTSKDVYISEPDTTKCKFDVVTIESDLSIPRWNNTVPGLISITSNREIWIALPEQQYSGGSAPTSQWALWYDTINNLIKSSSDAGSSWKEGYCLPIAICTADSSNWTSIDQVFNGFGYIGSTVFALPGVKGLIPNGRNADGSLNSREFTVDKVISKTYPYNIGTGWLALNANDLGVVNFTYNEVDNYVYNNNTIASYVSQAGYMVAESSGKITSFTPKTTFHALDYNDKSTISSWGMPSGRFIDLALGASGSTYAAPANGYFYLLKVAGNDLGYINFLNKTKDLSQEYSPRTSNTWLFALMAAQKGDVFEIKYTASGDTKIFRFIFAEGEPYNLVRDNSNSGSNLHGNPGKL